MRLYTEHVKLSLLPETVAAARSLRRADGVAHQRVHEVVRHLLLLLALVLVPVASVEERSPVPQQVQVPHQGATTCNVIHSVTLMCLHSRTRCVPDQRVDTRGCRPAASLNHPSHFASRIYQLRPHCTTDKCIPANSAAILCENCRR